MERFPGLMLEITPLRHLPAMAMETMPFAMDLKPMQQVPTLRLLVLVRLLINWELLLSVLERMPMGT